MSSIHALMAEYHRRPRPGDIGDVVGGVRLGELDDEVQDVLASWGMGSELGLFRIARLGLAVADAERVMPLLAAGETREYLALLVALGRAGLESAARGELEPRR